MPLLLADDIDWSGPLDWESGLNRGLVAEWPTAAGLSQDWGTSTLRNAWQNTHHGAVQGSWAQDDWKGARYLHESLWGCVDVTNANRYIAVPYSAALNPSQFTVGAWAAYEGTTVLNNRIIIGSRNQSGANVFGWLLMNAIDGTWQFWTGPGSTTWNVLAGGGHGNQGRWTYLVGTYDGTSMRLYQDGIRVAGPTVATYSANTSRELRIGAGRNETTAGDYFDGKIAHPFVRNVCLSDAEVLALYEDTAFGLWERYNILDGDDLLDGDLDGGLFSPEPPPTPSVGSSITAPALWAFDGLSPVGTATPGGFAGYTTGAGLWAFDGFSEAGAVDTSAGIWRPIYRPRRR